MKCLSLLLCLCSFTIAAAAEPLPAAPSGPPVQEKPKPPPPQVQISVQLDWIKVPHLTANQLVRQRMKHCREANDLYAAVQELLAQKKAERLDLTALSVHSGQRSKSESIADKPYPGEHEPADAGAKINAAGEKTAGPLIPAVPTGFSIRNTGVTAEVEATLGASGRAIDLNIAPEWVEHLTDVAWGKGVAEIKQPVFGAMKLYTQIATVSGAWQLAGLFTPPAAAAAGKPPGSFPLPADRVFLFVRASVPALPNAKDPPPQELPRQVMVLAEWIDMEAATAASLLAKYPGFSGNPALRQDLELMITDGRASLLQTAALLVRGGQRSKIESVIEYPFPQEMNSPSGGSVPVKDKPGQSPLDVPGISTGMTPVTYSGFAFRNVGTTMEAETTISEAGDAIELNLQPTLDFHAGLLRFGKGDSEVTQPRFQSLKPSVQILLMANKPAMTASFDMPGKDAAVPGARGRKVLFFVRGIR
ncbi:MAG TPA: hypothetical protein VG796_23635 [Verrucomicrobiales bacterium]|nr:hypothetical protein [Verrucomicrobiales bacterium]